MKKAGKVIVYVLLIIVVLLNGLVTWVDRTPYSELGFYDIMKVRMDSLKANTLPLIRGDSTKIGWSTLNITPSDELPLAGYGARKPKTMNGIHDSTYIRTFVVDNGIQKVAVVTVDLLIVHPEVDKAFTRALESIDWDRSEVYLSATHTHSGFGSWAPGFVGDLFAGEYQPKVVEWVAERMVSSIVMASKMATKGKIGYGEMSVPDMIRNRLVGLRGTTDPWLKTLLLYNQRGKGIHAFYGAHATCLDYKMRHLSGDFPAVFSHTLTNHAGIDYAGYSAGAVGSMGPLKTDAKGWEKAMKIGQSLAAQVDVLITMEVSQYSNVGIRSYHIPLELREPNLKISGNLRIRPWVFRKFVGDYDTRLSVLQIDDILMIGLPCDFSGELSTELYAYARSKGLNLVLSSFNGDYIGYVIKDDWYDLEKYESRTMSWYGFDNGSYFVEIIKGIIDITAQ
jgi:hypothetical protein